MATKEERPLTAEPAPRFTIAVTARALVAVLFDHH